MSSSLGGEDGTRSQSSVRSCFSAPDFPQMRRFDTTALSGSYLAGIRYRAHRVIKSREFDTAIGVIIVLNSGFCGLEQSYRLHGTDVSFLPIAEHLFLAVYITEIGLRFFASGLRCLADAWVRFDFLLVTGALLSEVLPLFFPRDSYDVGPLTIVRVARLLRFARLVRVLNKFRELWMLVHGFISSAKTMCYTMLVLAVMLYVFGMVGVELITFREEAPDVHYKEAAENYFSSLPITMLTLLQFVNMDSVSPIYRPLILGDWTLAFYFISVIMVIAIVLMNIITAVIVNAALEQAHENREAQLAVVEKKKKRLMNRLRTMFERMDRDGSGHLDKEELQNAEEDDRLLLNEMLASTTLQPIDIFRALDIDGTGTLTIEEFCDGLYNASVTKTPIELKRLDKRMDCVTKQLASLVDVGKQVEAVTAQIATVIVSQSSVTEVCDEIRREVRLLRGAPAVKPSSCRTSDSMGEATTEDSASNSSGNFPVPKDPQEPCHGLFSPTLSYSMKDCEDARAALRSWEKEEAEQARAALRKWEQELAASSSCEEPSHPSAGAAAAGSHPAPRGQGCAAAQCLRPLGVGMGEEEMPPSHSAPPSKTTTISDVEMEILSGQAASWEPGEDAAGSPSNVLQRLLEHGILGEGQEIPAPSAGRTVSC